MQLVDAAPLARLVLGIAWMLVSAMQTAPAVQPAPKARTPRPERPERRPPPRGEQ